jgi:hypothetical protein
MATTVTADDTSVTFTALACTAADREESLASTFPISLTT